ncbi:MAG: YihY/virulence factor BrkB family protein [Deltaproteobacteria bacterium]|nr:YihY/virulence factor BrkB family protein [Deltaproteobacteria bacterium]
MRAVLREALRIFSARGARFLGAAVAFYALLSAAPLFVVVLHVVGAVFGREKAESALWEGLSRWLAPDGLATVRALTAKVDLEGKTGVLGFALVIFGSTRLFRALHRAVNQLFGVDLEQTEAAHPRHVRYARAYGRALGLIVLVALLVAAQVVAKGTFAVIASMSVRPPPAMLWVLDVGTSVVVAFVLFFAVLRTLPEVPITHREAAVSALVSTLLFALGSVVVTLYLQHKQIGDLYDGAGAVVVAVLWVYYSAQVFFLGVCVGAAMHRRAA